MNEKFRVLEAKGVSQQRQPPDTSLVLPRQFCPGTTAGCALCQGFPSAQDTQDNSRQKQTAWSCVCNASPLPASTGSQRRGPRKLLSVLSKQLLIPHQNSATTNHERSSKALPQTKTRHSLPNSVHSLPSHLFLSIWVVFQVLCCVHSALRVTPSAASRLHSPLSRPKLSCSRAANHS